MTLWWTSNKETDLTSFPLVQLNKVLLWLVNTTIFQSPSILAQTELTPDDTSLGFSDLTKLPLD